MLNNLDLSTAERRLYQQQLCRSRGLEIELRIFDLDGNLQHSLRPVANTGQVNVVYEGEVSRSASLTFMDPSRALQFDSDSPNPTALYFDRMVQILHRTFVPELGRSITAPIFTGPLTKFDRTGDEVTVEAQGKEILAQRGCPTMTIKGGANAVSAIRQIMTYRAGETLFSFPTHPRKLPGDRVVSWEQESWPWAVCQRMAAGLRMQLYYDGGGTLRLRTLPEDSMFTFHSGELGNVTSLVQISHDRADVRNRVHVTGSQPTFTAEALLPDSHPFSAERLKRNGVRMFLSEEIEDSNLSSLAAVKARASSALSGYSKMAFGSTFNAIPIPHLDTGDMVHIDTDEYVGTERLRDFSFPLTGGDMTVGFNDLVTLPARVNRA